MTKYRKHKYETWLPERPKKVDKEVREEENTGQQTEQQRRNEKFDF